MKFWAIQAFYCLSGIGFFIQDLFDRVPQGAGYGPRLHLALRPERQDCFNLHRDAHRIF